MPLAAGVRQGGSAGAEVSFSAATASVSSHEAPDCRPEAALGQRGWWSGESTGWIHNEEEQRQEHGAGIHRHLCVYLSQPLTRSDLQRMVASLLLPKAHANSLLPNSNPESHRERHYEKHSFLPKFNTQQSQHIPETDSLGSASAFMKRSMIIDLSSQIPQCEEGKDLGW